MSTKDREKLAGLGMEGSSHKVARQGFIVSFMTFLSRVSGLIRDIALSYVFGASAHGRSEARVPGLGYGGARKAGEPRHLRRLADYRKPPQRL